MAVRLPEEPSRLAIHLMGALPCAYPGADRPSNRRQSELVRAMSEGRTGRLSAIRESQVRSFSRPVAPPQLLSKLRRTLRAAQREGDNAAAACRTGRQLSPDGRHVLDVAGWAQVWVHDSQSPIVAGLQELGEGFVVPGEGYCISSLGGLGWRGDQALCLVEAKARAAKSVFGRAFPDVSFGITSKWD